MKKLLRFLILLPGLAWAAPEQQVELALPTGMVTNYDSLNLKPTFVKDAQNVFFDQDLGSSKRGGYSRENTISFGSQTVRDMYGFIPSTLTVVFSTNSTEYLVVFTGSTMAYSLGSDTWTIVTTTLNPNFHVDCAKLGGRLWCVNGDRKFAWAGSTSVIDLSGSGFPNGTMIESHADRLWVGGVPGDESSVYASGFNDGLNWTLGGNAGDPLIVPVGARDGKTLSCMRSYSDALILGKRGSPGSMWAIVGKSQEDFTKKNLSEQVGCSDDRSVQEKQGKLYWLSNRGIERFSEGIADPPFGDPIKDWTDLFLKGSAISKASSVNDTAQSDFVQGKSTYTDLISIPDSIVPLQPSTKTINGTEACISFGGSSRYLGNQNSRKIAQSFRSKLGVASTLISAKLLLEKNTTAGGSPWDMLTVSISSSDQAFSTKPANVPLSQKVFTANQIPAVAPCAGFYTQLTEIISSTVSLLSNVTYWIVAETTAPVIGGNSGQPPFQLSVSTLGNAYMDGFAYFVNATSSEEFTDTTDFYFQVTFSSSQFFSRIIDLGDTNPTNGRFNADYVPGDGSVVFYTRTHADSSLINSQAWTAQTLGSPITLSRYFQWRGDLSMANLTNTPAIQSVLLTYGGLQEKMRVASWVVDGRYYLSGSTNTTPVAGNETILVVDKFDNFTRLNGMNALSFATAFGRTYFGTSQSTSPQGGLFYRMTDNFSDDGIPIDAFIRLRDDCAGNCAQDKYFSTVYVKTKNDGATGGNLSVATTFERDNTTYVLGEVSLDEGVGLIFAKVPFPLGSYGVRGKSVSFLLRNNQLGHDFRYYGGSVNFRPTPVE